MKTVVSPLLNFVVALLGFLSTLTHATTPLEDLVLARGRSRAILSPDYLFKLVDQISLNSGYSAEEVQVLIKEVSNCGILELSDEDLFALDREVRRIMDPFFDKYFPGKLRSYNLLFLNSNYMNAALLAPINKSSPVTFLFDRGFLKIVEYEEELIGTHIHELGHHLEVRLSTDQAFDRLLKSMAAEERADTLATRALIESDRSPLGYSLVMEKVLSYQNSPSRERNLLEGRVNVTGFFTHPPTETRLTRINAMIEKAADKKTFAPLTPVASIFEKIRKAPDTPKNLSQVRYTAVAAEDLGKAIGSLEGLYSGQRVSESTLLQVRDELNTIKRRLSERNLKQWSASGTWDNSIGLEFHNVWHNLPGRLKALKTTQDFYYEQEQSLRETALAVGAHFVPFEEHSNTQLKLLADIRTIDDIRGWHKLVSQTLNIGHHPFSYGVYKDPALFINAFEAYLQMLPQLYYWIYNGEMENDPTTLAAIKNYRETMADGKMLDEWYHLTSTFPEPQKWIAADVLKARVSGEEDYRYRRSDELIDQLESASFEKWRKIVDHLQLPQVARFLFLLPREGRGHFGRWTWRGQESHTSGRVYFPTSLDLINYPERGATSFDEFQRGIRLVRAFEGISDDKGKTVDRFPFDFSQFEWWLRDVLFVRIPLSVDTTEKVLESDLYWHIVSRSRQRERARNFAHRWSGWVLDKIDAYVEPVRTRERKRLFRDIDETVDDFFGDDNFYSRPEYQLNEELVLGLQVRLYENLQNHGGLPRTLNEEVDLWQKFAKRGVTSFTDEWAGSIVSRAIRSQTDEGTQCVRRIYYSNLVWDLQTRERMAIFILSPQHSALVDATKNATRRGSSFLTAKPPRSTYINELLRQITREFPELSQERIRVVDRVARHIRASPQETSEMMAAVEQERRELADVEVSRKEAFGVRFFAQIFSELQSSGVHHILGLLEYLLGKTDRVPHLLQEIPNRYGSGSFDRQEHLVEPLLFYIRRNVRPARIRMAFQTLSQDARTVLLDPFFLGSRGILAMENGREWIADMLLPGEVPWRQMAIDLVEGWRDGLILYGQGHLKTMFISYLVAASVRTSSTDFGHFFPTIEGDTLSVDADSGHAQTPEAFLGRMLRTLFSANAATQKIGQRVHSSNIFEPEINRFLGSLKETANYVLREDQFSWLSDAARCDDVCNRVRIEEDIGNASVKIVLSAKIEGQDRVLYLTKPNALRRGIAFFEIVEHAIQFAIDRGHHTLRLIQPMVARAKITFADEINLVREREAAEKLSKLYRPGKSYGGYQFITPEFIDVSKLLDPSRAAAVRKIRVKKFSDLNPEERGEFAKAVTEKENELHRAQMSSLVLEKDRHEGNYLLVTDEEYLAELGIKDSKLILVIDFGQVFEIAPPTRQAIVDAVAIVAGYQNNLLPLEGAAGRLVHLIKEDLAVASDVSNSIVESILAILPLVKDQSSANKPGEALSRFLSYVEAPVDGSPGVPIRPEVWDYLAAVVTNQTWDKYAPQNIFSQSMRNEITAQCMQMLMGGDTKTNILKSQ